jgi:uncharacterized coiled-coil protein SlyX
MNREQDYTIEALGPMFDEHARKLDALNEALRIKFQEDYPHEELPEHMKGQQFSVSRALATMAYEIEKLKRK